MFSCTLAKSQPPIADVGTPDPTSFCLFGVSQAPVLAKRKTKTMKEMENASVKRAETRGKSAARRANMTQQFVIPDHTTTDYERQLKKIATRGGKPLTLKKSVCTALLCTRCEQCGGTRGCDSTTITSCEAGIQAMQRLKRYR